MIGQFYQCKRFTSVIVEVQGIETHEGQSIVIYTDRRSRNYTATMAEFKQQFESFCLDHDDYLSSITPY